MTVKVSDYVYWLTTVKRGQARPLTEDVAVDFAIVGGGFTGLSTAYHLKLAEPSARIAIFESEYIGFGASGRNGGFSMTLFGLTLPITALRFGKKNAAAAYRYMAEAVDTTQTLIGDLDLDCDYEHSGFLRVATSSRYEKRIRHDVDLANKLGFENIEWLEADELAEQVRSPMYRGAWSEPRCGILNPAKLARAWKTQLESMGVEIYEATRVNEINPGVPNATLVTPNGKISARQVVIATNGYSHMIPQLKWKQMPVWTHIVLTEPLSDKQMETIGWINRQGIEDARGLVHYYRLTADNRLLMGGRDVSMTFGKNMDKDLNPKVFAGLEADVVEIFPSLAGIKFTHRWGGPVSVPLDMAPVIGQMDNNQIVFSLGCVGHAVSMTHLNGKTISELLLEQTSERTEMFFVNRRTIPIPPEPFRAIVGNGIRGYLKLEDRVND